MSASDNRSMTKFPAVLELINVGKNFELIEINLARMTRDSVTAGSTAPPALAGRLSFTPGMMDWFKADEKMWRKPDVRKSKSEGR